MPCDSVFVCILRVRSSRRAAIACAPKREELISVLSFLLPAKSFPPLNHRYRIFFLHKVIAVFLQPIYSYRFASVWV